MAHTTLNLEQFTELVKDVKFTPAQNKIVNRLIKGDQLWLLNSHRRSGGEYMWRTKYSSNPEYAGSVYKAFWNIQYVIRKQKGIQIDCSIFLYRD
jgi:hypothetical protein